MGNPVSYMLHDYINNIEEQITNYDQELLRKAEDDGYIIVAVDEDGSRHRVHASDVHKPKPMVGGVEIATPAYVNERIRAVANAIEAVKDSLPEDKKAQLGDALASLNQLSSGEEE